MRFVRSPAAARNTTGSAMFSHAAEWCSPTHASSKPISSHHWISSRSRRIDRCGLSPSRWYGAMNVPKVRWAGTWSPWLTTRGRPHAGAGGQRRLRRDAHDAPAATGFDDAFHCRLHGEEHAGHVDLDLAPELVRRDVADGAGAEHAGVGHGDIEAPIARLPQV